MISASQEPTTSSEPATFSKEKRSSNIFWVGLALILTILSTKLVLAYSTTYGRLASEPTYDDVSYLLDGYWRYQIAQSEGIIGYLKAYREVPPHSPLESLTATLGYAIFAPEDWAPYALNGVVAFGLFLIALFLVRDGPPLLKASALFFLLLVPFTFLGIHEFRPDAPAAVCIAGGMLLANEAFICRKRKYLWGAGFAFSLALLYKPTIFPYTLTLLGCSVFIGYFHARLVTRNWPSPITYLLHLYPLFIPLLLAFPHYLLGFDHLYHYIVENVFGANKEVWASKRPWYYRPLFHLTGYKTSGEYMLGRFALFSGSFVLLGLFIFSKMRVEPPARQRFWLSALATLLAYIFIVINHVENIYFGLTFQMLLVFTTLIVMTGVIVALHGRGWIKTAVLINLVLIFLMIQAHRPTRRALKNGIIDPTVTWYTTDDDAQYAKLLINKVVQETARILPYADAPLLANTFHGLASPDTLKWAARDHSFSFGAFAIPLTDSLETFQNRLLSYNLLRPSFILAAEASAHSMFHHLPPSRIAQPLLDWLKSHESFVPLFRFPGEPGKSYWFFVREPEFGGWDKEQGLLKPHLESTTTQAPLRILSKTPAELEFVLEKEGECRLQFGFHERSGPILLKLNGHLFETIALQDLGRTELRFSGRAGTNLLTLEFAEPNTPKATFKRLRLYKPGVTSFVRHLVPPGRTFAEKPSIATAKEPAIP